MTDPRQAQDQSKKANEEPARPAPGSLEQRGRGLPHPATRRRGNSPKELPSLFPGESRRPRASLYSGTLAEGRRDDGIGNRYESQCRRAHWVMDRRSSGNGAERDAALAADGGLGLPLGRHPQVRVRQPGSRPLHEVGDTAAGSQRPLRRRARDRRGRAASPRLRHASHCHRVHHRDGRGNSLDEDRFGFAQRLQRECIHFIGKLSMEATLGRLPVFASGSQQ